MAHCQKVPVNYELVLLTSLHRADAHNGVDVVLGGGIYDLGKWVSSVEGHRKGPRAFRRPK